ncbi:hypothetical protein [Celerinatantimonas sp. YJH-8]|uniref:hypothetical protein n=1 Tax=Celerinatantimonas sp. YJH-8 TaxID=3228714 RepID=UPI0038C2F703
MKLFSRLLEWLSQQRRWLLCGLGIIVVILLAWGLRHNPIFTAFVSFMISLARSCTIVGLAWVTLRLFDRSCHLTFQQWSGRVDDPYHQIAMGLYFGLRCLAVFLAFAIGMA